MPAPLTTRRYRPQHVGYREARSQSGSFGKLSCRPRKTCADPHYGSVCYGFASAKSCVPRPEETKLSQSAPSLEMRHRRSHRAVDSRVPIAATTTSGSNVLDLKCRAAMATGSVAPSHIGQMSRPLCASARGSRMRPPPIGYHSVADILREAERLRATGSTVSAPGTASRSIPREIVGTRARVPGCLIPGDAVLNDGLTNLGVGKRLA
jgi:hypothetical protein